VKPRNEDCAFPAKVKMFRGGVGKKFGLKVVKDA